MTADATGASSADRRLPDAARGGHGDAFRRLDGAHAVEINSFVAPTTRGPDRERFAADVFGRFGLPHELA
jgi:hypothetical protein